MDPAFKRKFLKGLMQEFNNTSDEFISKLSKYARSQTFVPMLDEFRHCTLDLIGKVAFGMNINSINNDSNQFAVAIDTILAAMYAQLFKFDFGMNPWKWAFYKKSREALMFLRNVGKELIENREAAMRLGQEVPLDVLTHSIKTSQIEGSGLNKENIIDDFINFFIAGHETTANTLSFTLLELGRHPNILQRLREELSVVVGDEEYLTYDHIHRLRYMDMVIRESMRLYPTAPSTFRKLNRSCDIGGYRIPEKTIVMVSNFVATRNPDVFEHPLKFIPERFDSRSSKKVSVYSSIPFSLGPRSCLGKTFATIQTKVILAKFLLSFDFELDMKQSFEMIEVATLKPKSKVNCLLYER
ncbi:cholesterol 24-hydroxylase-like [Watersipora subatra]|uniref:cholesterol 24-hydroxylase-like n=1 Tax=Watersipora subatra TaxID=2589382 RepID=UPI00355C4138